MAAKPVLGRFPDHLSTGWLSILFLLTGVVGQRKRSTGFFSSAWQGCVCAAPTSVLLVAVGSLPVLASLQARDHSMSWFNEGVSH